MPFTCLCALLLPSVRLMCAGEVVYRLFSLLVSLC